jgi:predicted nucleic acid-binding protein
MSGELVLIDTVIFIDHFNGHEVATHYLHQVAGRAFLSAITRAEVLAGFEGPDVEVARQLLDRFPCLSIDEEVADIAARLLRDSHWRLPDALQAAVATHHGLSLATRNTRDFDPHRDRFVVVPYRL